MEKLKWPENVFKCVKCGHGNFIKNPKNLSRKCSKCTHIESVTANTLFHGIKFPLQKAFYLTYSYIHGLDGTSLTYLSSQIEIRLHTCSHFISKVKKILSVFPAHSSADGNLIMKNLLIPIKQE
ncbi:MAG: hypothetical protein K2Q22_01370 [Cytophagales bacterium]|nr:hypothetical protein [Cytophagales bacterium]